MQSKSKYRKSVTVDGANPSFGWGVLTFAIAFLVFLSLHRVDIPSVQHGNGGISIATVDIDGDAGDVAAPDQDKCPFPNQCHFSAVLPLTSDTDRDPARLRFPSVEKAGINIASLPPSPPPKTV